MGVVAERKFKCQICGLTYRFVAELTRHSKTHVNDSGDIVRERRGDSRRRLLDDDATADDESQTPDVPEPRSKKARTEEEAEESLEGEEVADDIVEPVEEQVEQEEQPVMSPVKKPRKMLNFKNANLDDSTANDDGHDIGRH